LVSQGQLNRRIRVLAGAAMGVGLSAMFAAVEDPEADAVSLIDEGLAQLQAGFPT
jgi:hypothetical protein